jgi:hypothetical protein
MTDIMANSYRSRRRSQFRLPGIVAVAAASTVLLVAACGSGSPSSSGPTAGSRYQQALVYAQCMRSHGMPTWPDPSSNGGFLFTAGNALNRASHAYLSASAACKDLQPEGSGLTAAQLQAGLARLLKFSVCMRAHGLGNFPDPQVVDSGGRRGLTLEMRGSGVDPSSPLYQSASRACQHLLPQAGKATPS